MCLYQYFPTLVEAISNIAARETKAHPGLRRGQALFNALYTLDPKLANKTRGIELDPFYDDKKVPKFLERVSRGE